MDLEKLGLSSLMLTLLDVLEDDGSELRSIVDMADLLVLGLFPRGIAFPLMGRSSTLIILEMLLRLLPFRLLPPAFDGLLGLLPLSKASSAAFWTSFTLMPLSLVALELAVLA